MKNKNKKVLKKKLEDFIKDETGYISKEKILKIGLGTISALGIMSAFSSNLIAGHGSHAQHTNTIGRSDPIGPCVRITHASHSSHASHSAY
jgi:hypothetical protein